MMQKYRGPIVVIRCCVSIGALIATLLYMETIWHPVFICVAALTMIALFWLDYKYAATDKIQKKWLVFLGAVVFSIFFILDQKIVHTGQLAATIENAYLMPIGRTDLVMLPVLSVLCYHFVCFLFIALNFVLQKLDRSNCTIINAVRDVFKAKRFGLWVFLILVASWSLYWLSHFPGTGVHDVHSIWKSPLSAGRMHPLTYNYLLYGLMSLGNWIGGDWSWGVAIYSFVQMIFCAWCVSFAINWLAKRDKHGLLTILALLFFTFSRVVANVTVIAVKDTIFSFGLLLMVPLLYECAETNGTSLLQRRNLILFICASIITILIRNNGVFVMIGVAVFVVVIGRKHWKRILAICLVAVILPYATEGILMKTLVKGEKSAVGALGVPLQQMAAVVARDGDIDTDELEVINTIMPLEELRNRYRPSTADTIKFGEGAKYFNRTWIDQNTDVFLKTWASMLTKNLDTYIEAYLLLTMSYWNVGEPCSTQGLYYDFPKSSSSTLIVEQQRVFPEKIHNSLQEYYQLDRRKDSPSGGTLIWLLILMAIYLVSKGQSKYLLCFIPVALVWCTVMISAPIAFGFRYILALYLAFPFTTAVAVMNIPQGEHNVKFM